MGDPEQGPIHLTFHGGGLIFPGGELVRSLVRVEARVYGLPTWSVDYRMPPRHPYPATVEGGLMTYRALLQLRDPQEIAVGGGSAGGNVAAATMLRARAVGLPLPAALVFLTPKADLIESGDSVATLAGKDSTLTSLRAVNELYADGRPLDNRGVSPLFGDLHGLPPVFVQSGTHDLFPSNAVRVHRQLLEVRARQSSTCSRLWGFRTPIWAVTCAFTCGTGLASGRLDVAVQPLLYALTRNALGLMLLRVHGDTAKNGELLVLRHQVAVLRRWVHRPVLEPNEYRNTA